ncbi:hypothetical protein BGX27_002741 [Mortierella sp. AM989]|nr:hypothetical protein BGX27_002741 [Mortierella sp. AM989]
MSSSALDPSSGDREEVTDTWRNKVVPGLESSDLPEPQQAGHRLASEWNSKKSSRGKFWSNLKEKKQEKMEKEKRRRRVRQHTYDCYYPEEEKFKLQQTRKASTAMTNKTTGEFDNSGHEEQSDGMGKSTLITSEIADHPALSLHDRMLNIGYGISEFIPTADRRRQSDEYDQANIQPRLFHELEGNEDDDDDEVILVNARASTSRTTPLKRPKSRPPPVSIAAAEPLGPSSSSSASTSSAPVPLSLSSPSSTSAGPLSSKRKRKGSIVETEESWRSIMQC